MGNLMHQFQLVGIRNGISENIGYPEDSKEAIRNKYETLQNRDSKTIYGIKRIPQSPNEAIAIFLDSIAGYPLGTSWEK
jgi:hypothetical protein